MKLLDLPPDDRRWLARWLRGNFACVLITGGLLLGLRLESNVPVMRIKPALADQNQIVTQADSIPPQGWRRTANGWEHVSQWRTRPERHLEEWVAIQQDRESVWVRHLLMSLRKLSPITYAMIQLTLIALIFWFAEQRKEIGSKQENAT